MNILKSLVIACPLLFCAPASFANPENTGTGTVAETMNVGAYVYVRLEENDTWVASTPVPVAVGDQVTYTGGAMMKDFYSPKLGRKFESILFVMKLEVTNQVNADTHASTAPDDPHSVAKSTTAVVPGPGDISPLDGGKTIAEIYAEHEQMEGQLVTLRAKVMKFSPDILGKNWITLQDGTGTAPNNKLLATSTEEVDIDQIVMVRGVIRNNVDLGSGYKYTVVLEETVFAR